MNCTNCGQPIEAGAAFCGNCGFPVPGQAPPAQTAAPVVSSPIPQVYANQQSAPPVSPPPVMAAAGVPNYAVPVAGQQHHEMQASMSLVAGIAGLLGGLFIPILGIGLGVTGIVLGQISRRYVKKGISLAGIIISCLAILAGIANWVYVVQHDPNLTHKTSSNKQPLGISGPTVSAQQISTPCYSFSFDHQETIQNNQGSCNMDAYNGSSFTASTDVYKIYGTESAVTSANFTSFAKQAIEKDISQTLPTFTISSETSGEFSGSPAYFVTANNGQGVSVIEATALHTTSNGDNFFVFVHAENASSVDLKDLEANWKWQ